MFMCDSGSECARLVFDGGNNAPTRDVFSRAEVLDWQGAERAVLGCIGCSEVRLGVDVHGDSTHLGVEISTSALVGVSQS